MSPSLATATPEGEEAPSAIRVLVRVRPLNDREKQSSKSILQLQSGDETAAIDFGGSSLLGEESSSSARAEGTVTIAADQQGSSSFTYDAVFGPESKQL